MEILPYTPAPFENSSPTNAPVAGLTLEESPKTPIELSPPTLIEPSLLHQNHLQRKLQLRYYSLH